MPNPNFVAFIVAEISFFIGSFFLIHTFRRI